MTVKCCITQIAISSHFLLMFIKIKLISMWNRCLFAIDNLNEIDIVSNISFCFLKRGVERHATEVVKTHAHF